MSLKLNFYAKFTMLFKRLVMTGAYKGRQQGEPCVGTYPLTICKRGSML